MNLAELDAELAALPADLREGYIRVGRQYGSDATLGQADRTLNGCAQYGAQVAAEGFSAADAQALAHWRDGLVLAMGGRSGARVGRKSTNQDLVAAMKAAKARRMSARSVLKSVPSKLRALNTDDGRSAAGRVEGVLGQTESAGADPKKLAGQLDLLAGMLDDAAVQGVVEAGLAASKAAVVRAAATSVRTAEAKRSVPAGTPQETQRMDLLDGLIIERVRAARSAARAASREAGDPAIEKAFELVDLYG